MRRSLRRMGNTEVSAYAEDDQLFTVLTLEEAKDRVLASGRECSDYCFHSWVREGVRYFRVWEDKRMTSSVAQAVPFGQIAATLKRAEAEKLFIKAKRYRGDMVRFSTQVGHLTIMDANSLNVMGALSLPVTGGELIFEAGQWTEGQAAHFVNVLLVRDRPVDEAFSEAEEFQQ